MTNFLNILNYNIYMKIKIFDEESELDLEEDINKFICDKEVIDIKYSVSLSVFSEEQIYSFSALIIYEE